MGVDGPTHFVTDGAGARRAGGAGVLKRRLLAAAGYRVAPVPLWEWEAAAHGDAAGRAGRQATCLRRLLEL